MKKANDIVDSGVKKKERVKILEVAIEELRRELDFISRNYDSVRSKALLFIGAEFAFLSYFFGDKGFSSFPIELYVIVFSSIAIVICIVALGYLLVTINPSDWELPPEQNIYKDLKFDDHLSYLEYVKSRYLTSIKINAYTCKKRHSYLSTAFILLLVGVTLLLVIKFLIMKGACL